MRQSPGVYDATQTLKPLQALGPWTTCSSSEVRGTIYQAARECPMYFAYYCPLYFNTVHELYTYTANKFVPFGVMLCISTRSENILSACTHTV